VPEVEAEDDLDGDDEKESPTGVAWCVASGNVGEKDADQANHTNGNIVHDAFDGKKFLQAVELKLDAF